MTLLPGTGNLHVNEKDSQHSRCKVPKKMLLKTAEAFSFKRSYVFDSSRKSKVKYITASIIKSKGQGTRLGSNTTFYVESKPTITKAHGR